MFDVFVQGSSIFNYGFDRALINKNFNLVTNMYIKYSFVFYFLAGLSDLGRGSKLNAFFFIMLIFLTGNKFSGIINFLFWYMLAFITYSNNLKQLSILGMLKLFKYRLFGVVICFSCAILYVYSLIDNVDIFELLVSRILVFQGQLWWYFHNFTVSEMAASYQLHAEIDSILGRKLEIQTGIEYMMSFIMPPVDLELMKERGYLYTFGYPTIYLALGYPFIGIILSFVLSVLILALYNQIKGIVTIGDFLYVLITLVVLSPMLNYAKVGSISEFATLPLLIKLFALAFFYIGRKIHKVGYEKII